MFVALQSYGTCLIFVKARVKTEDEKEQDTTGHQAFRFPLQNCSFYASVFTMD